MLKVIEYDGNLKEIAQKLNNRKEEISIEVNNAVNDIINDIRKNGNQALINYCRKFDGYQIKDENDFVVSNQEKEEALNKIRNKTKEDLYKLSTAQLEYNKALLEEQLVLKTKQVQDAKAAVANDGLFGKTDLEKKADKARESELQQELKEIRELKSNTTQVLKDRESILSNIKKTGELQTRYARDKALEEEAVKFIKKNEEETVSLLY